MIIDFFKCTLAGNNGTNLTLKRLIRCRNSIRICLCGKFYDNSKFRTCLNFLLPSSQSTLLTSRSEKRKILFDSKRYIFSFRHKVL